VLEEHRVAAEGGVEDAQVQRALEPMMRTSEIASTGVASMMMTLVA
jgi:hypothetical protein